MSSYTINKFTGEFDKAGEPETDPLFSEWLLSTPPLYSESDPVFSAWLSATPPLYAEADTLGTVTARGATTAVESTFSSGVITPEVHPSADSTTAFSIFKADGTTGVVTVDTTNGKVGVGATGAPSDYLDVHTGATGGITVDGIGAGTGIDAYTMLCAHLNTDFSDSSSYNRTPTLVNTPTIDTTNKKFGAGSALVVNATPKYFTYPASADWNFGTGDFTIEMWVKFNGTSNFRYFIGCADGASANGWGIYYNYGSGTAKVRGFTISGGGYIGDTGEQTITTPNTSDFYHVAYVRYGTSFKVYWNGTATSAGVTSSSAAGWNNSTLNIGPNGAGANCFDGNIDEVRISKGIARYTGNFTPPVAEFGSSIVTPSLTFKGSGTQTAKVYTDGSASDAFKIDVASTTRLTINPTTGQVQIVADDQELSFGAGQDFTIKFNGTDPVFSMFPLTPSSAPDQDYEVANKKYVDDEVGGIDLSGYAKLDASNQPFTGNLNVSKADPEMRLTDSGNSEYTRLLKTDTTNYAYRKNRVVIQAAMPTGGTITTSGDYTIHTFPLGAGTFTAYTSFNAEVLVVAGGGSGAKSANYAGGGGAGGLIYNASYAITPGAKTVMVGAGGLGVSVNSNGNNGGNSVFDSLTAIGGGGGGREGVTAGAGGSGGGGASSSGGAGTAGQGNKGGGGGAAGAGGGGAGAVGANPWGTGNYNGGNGGAGLEYSISGTALWYAGGGGGSKSYFGSANGTGGSGVGGDGSRDGTAGDGTNGRGGGGGGCNFNTSGDGGNGVVIVRYLTADIVAGTDETTVWSSRDGITAGERGVQTYGDTDGRTVIEGATTRFNVVGVEKGKLDSTGLTWIDSFKELFGTASDAGIWYDGTNFIINPKLVGTGFLSILGDISLLDEDIILGTTTGTKIGTATSQKLGFYNATPVVQQIATTDLGVALSNLGLRAAGTAYPITTTGLVSLGNTTTALQIGAGNAGTDYRILFDGETNDGVMTWMEDEDYFQFSDGILMNSTEEIFFRDTAISIKSADDGRLDITADVSIDLNGLVDAGNNTIQTTGSLKGVHKAADGTAAVADGTYTVGIGGTQNGTITIKDGIITAVQQAIP